MQDLEREDQIRSDQKAPETSRFPIEPCPKAKGQMRHSQSKVGACEIQSYRDL